MKFGTAKLPKVYYKNTVKSLNAKKQQLRIKRIRGWTRNFKFLLQWKKKFCHLASSMPLLREARGGALPSILVY